MAADPDALICNCGHPKPTHLFGERACEGEVEVEPSMKIEPCSCPRFKLWYNDDELTESEKEYIDGE
jgi:hypothetical protein